MVPNCIFVWLLSNLCWRMDGYAIKVAVRRKFEGLMEHDRHTFLVNRQQPPVEEGMNVCAEKQPI